MELMITVMLHKLDDNEWTEEELGNKSHGYYAQLFSFRGYYYIKQ
jgi:hypothetical protein